MTRPREQSSDLAIRRDVETEREPRIAVRPCRLVAESLAGSPLGLPA